MTTTTAPDRTQIRNASDLRFVKIGARLEISTHGPMGRTPAAWHDVIAISDDHLVTRRSLDGSTCVFCPNTMFKNRSQVINMMLQQ